MKTLLLYIATAITEMVGCYLLLLWLRGKYGRVSYERILSGPGLAGLYRFYRETRRGQEPPEVAMATPASHTGRHLREFLAQRKAE